MGRTLEWKEEGLRPANRELPESLPETEHLQSLAADEGLALDMGRRVVADCLGPAPALEREREREGVAIPKNKRHSIFLILA